MKHGNDVLALSPHSDPLSRTIYLTASYCCVYTCESEAQISVQQASLCSKQADHLMPFLRSTLSRPACNMASLCTLPRFIFLQPTGQFFPFVMFVDLGGAMDLMDLQLHFSVHSPDLPGFPHP